MYRYLGNKTRLAPWLISRISEIAGPGATVADLMCGTASVSESLRESGFKVIASDLMTYAAHHARVRLLLEDAPNFKALNMRYLGVIDYLNSLPEARGIFFKEYCPDGNPAFGSEPRMYLTATNAGKLDAINYQIGDWMKQGRLSDLEHSVLRHDLVLAVNRIANIAGTYGHYRSSWSKSALTDLMLRPGKFLKGFSTDHIVLQGAAEVLAKDITADLCYLDPPYMKRQYAANYHLIETIARGDEPEAIGISGLRPWRDQYSNFCTRTKIQDSFRQIIESMNCSKYLISYSSDGLLSEEELMNLFSPLGDVSIEKKVFPRFKSNKSKLGAFVTEFLITIIKKSSD